MNKKITTIEDLAVMLEGEFRRIDKRLDALEDYMNKMKSEMKEVRVDVAQLRKDFKDADTRTAVIAIELRVAALERRV
jgi:predicted  nucleic acid-binding Zn-ribbon protein